MSYHKDSGRKKKYDQPAPSAQKGGKPGIRPKGAFEKQMIEKAGQDVKAADSAAE
jgi:hypothetical protein